MQLGEPTMTKTNLIRKTLSHIDTSHKTEEQTWIQIKTREVEGVTSKLVIKGFYKT